MMGLTSSVAETATLPDPAVGRRDPALRVKLAQFMIFSGISEEGAS
jgi:hypothetical protein